MGYPPCQRQSSRASTYYAAGNMPPAWTQEDFLVRVRLHREKSRLRNRRHFQTNFMKLNLLFILRIRKDQRKILLLRSLPLNVQALYTTEGRRIGTFLGMKRIIFHFPLNFWKDICDEKWCVTYPFIITLVTCFEWPPIDLRRKLFQGRFYFHI